MMRYDKTGQFELKRDVALIMLYVGILCQCNLIRYIVLFIILNAHQRKIESKIGFGHHVEGNTVDVNANSNEVNRKCFKVGGIPYKVDRNCKEGDRNGVKGNRKSFNADGNHDVGRGKKNNGNRKALIVKGKCVIVSKNNKIKKK